MQFLYRLRVVRGFVDSADGQLLQPLRRVLGDHLHQLALFAALGDAQLHRAGALGSQPNLYRVQVVRQMLKQDSARRVGVRRVELLDERRHDLRLVVPVRSVHEEILAPDQLALTDEKHLHPSVPPLLRQRDYIRVFVGEMQNFLPLVHLLNIRQLVSKHGGALEF